MSKSKKNTKEKRQQISLFSSMKIELQKFKSKRDETFTILQEMCNLQNKASFVSPRNLSTSLGYSVEPNRFTVLFDDQFFQCKKEVISTSGETTSALISFANLLSVLSKDLNVKSVVDHESFVPVEDFILIRLLTDMQQQHALESQVFSVVNILCNLGDESNSDVVMDQDKLVSLLACFKYPPYLNMSHLDIILQHQ